jgi:hypothetical protein
MLDQVVSDWTATPAAASATPAVLTAAAAAAAPSAPVSLHANTSSASQQLCTDRQTQMLMIRSLLLTVLCVLAGERVQGPARRIQG